MHHITAQYSVLLLYINVQQVIFYSVCASVDTIVSVISLLCISIFADLCFDCFQCKAESSLNMTIKTLLTVGPITDFCYKMSQF